MYTSPRKMRETMPQTPIFSSMLGSSCSGQVQPDMGERCVDPVYQDGNLVSGSLEALIEHLVPTMDYYPDRTYIFTFLLSSRVFIHPHELLAKVGQLCIKQKQQLELGTEAEKAKLKSFAAKIIQLLKEWTETFPYDFQDEKSMKELKEIAHRITQCDEDRKHWNRLPEEVVNTPSLAVFKTGVEQEIMARVISGMYPVQKETVPSVSTSESEDSDTVTSDIVEVAGGGGFQLFINAGVPVDSEMISHFVNEALSETIATMLGNKQAQKAVPAANVLPSTVVMMESLVPTPLPTPQATPPQTPPSEKELPPVKTPESSLSLTEMSGDVHKHEQIKETGVEIPATTTRVGTPVVTPINTPPRTTTPSPSASEWVSKAAKMESPKPTNPWDDAELPLEEEKPSPLTEEPFCPKAVEMSVANDEEPEALILLSQQSSARPFESLPCNPQVPSPVSTVSSGQSTQESSLTLTETETETADRPISEGEVLFSYGQVLAARALGGGGLCLPNLAESLTSTLRDANEMDYDPPSEGQVVRRPDKGYHRDPVLTLLTKLNQAPLAAQEGIYHLEDSDDSVGQLSEGQRPRLTKAAERILMGHSVYMDHPTAQTSENRPHQRFRSPSPGQLAQIGEILGDEDTAHGPMLMAELESQPVSNPVLQAAQSSCRVTSLSEDLFQEESQGTVQVETVKPRVIYVRRKSEEMQQEGENAAPHLHSHVSAAKVSVKLPSMSTDNETQSSIHGDSESSGTDTF